MTPVRYFVLAMACGAAFTGSATAQTQRVPVQRNSSRQAAPAARTAQAPPQRPVQNPAPAPPFQLTAQQQARLDQLLTDWEVAGKQIEQFSVKFTRLEYRQRVIKAGSPAPGQQGEEATRSTGEIKYRRPDKGLYVARDPQGAEVEHWVTDGTTIFLFNFDESRVEAHALPPQLQGKGIEDGPLPFLFGTEAAKLKHRYWLRLDPPGTTPEPGQILLEATPKFQADAQNYRRAQVILDAKTLSMLGLQVYHADGKSRTVHVFGEPVINPKFQFLQKDFSKPATPPGWTLVPVPFNNPQQPPGPQRAATRPATQPAAPRGNTRVVR